MEDFLPQVYSLNGVDESLFVARPGPMNNVTMVQGVMCGVFDVILH